jgi:hypothetical protein
MSSQIKTLGRFLFIPLILLLSSIFTFPFLLAFLVYYYTKHTNLKPIFKNLIYTLLIIFAVFFQVLFVYSVYLGY